MTPGTVRSPVNGHVMDQTGDTVFHPMSEHRLVIYQSDREHFIWYPNTEKLYAKHEIHHLKTPRWKIISNTWRTASSHIQTLISIIYQTREGAYHLISRHREVIYKTRGGVFHLVSKHRELSNTRRSISSDIQTPRTNISNTRRSVLSDIQTTRTNISNKTNVLSDNQNPRSGIYISQHWEVTYQTPNAVLQLVSKQLDLT